MYNVSFDGIQTKLQRASEKEVKNFLSLFNCKPRVEENVGIVGKWISKGGRYIDVTSA